MSNSNLTILAKRDNTIFFIFPLLTPLCWMLFTLSTNEGVSFSSLLTIPACVMGFVWLVSFLRFVRRLFVPSVIMEYDNNYLYINKGLSGTTIIPFIEIINTSLLYEQANIGDILRMGRRRYSRTYEDVEKFFRALELISKTGIININHKDELIHLHGIKDVREVRAELFRIIKMKRQEFETEIEARIRKEQRQRELAKHDPNT